MHACMGPDFGDPTFRENAHSKHGVGVEAFKQRRKITIQMLQVRGTFILAPCFFFPLFECTCKKKHLAKNGRAGTHTPPTKRQIFFVLYVKVRSCFIRDHPVLCPGCARATSIGFGLIMRRTSELRTPMRRPSK